LISNIISKGYLRFSSMLYKRSCCLIFAFSLALFRWNSSSTLRIASSSPFLCLSLASASRDSFSANLRLSICRTVLWNVNLRPFELFFNGVLTSGAISLSSCKFCWSPMGEVLRCFISETFSHDLENLVFTFPSFAKGFSFRMTDSLECLFVFSISLRCKRLESLYQMVSTETNEIKNYFLLKS